MERKDLIQENGSRHRLTFGNQYGSTNPSEETLTENGANNKAEADNAVRLKPTLGLTSGVCFIAGTMIGSGIFISPKGVAEGAGSVGLTLIIWALCGCTCFIGALCYAELGTFIGKSGGEHTYLLEGISPLGRYGRIPAFLYAWVNMVILCPTTFAIQALTFGTYAAVPFFGACSTPPVLQKCLGIFAIGVVATVNGVSVKLASKVQIVFTLIKVLALAIVVIGGLVRLGQGETQYLSNAFEGTNSEVGNIVIGIYHGMFAYESWNNLNFVTEEIVNPNRNLPLSICIALSMTTILYVLANVSYFTVMPLQELISSPAVAVTWGDRVLGNTAGIIPVFVALSAIGAANGGLFSCGRLNFVASREGHTAELLSMVHVKHYTPFPSIIFTSTLASFLVIFGDIQDLIPIFGFAIWFFYGLTMAAQLIMRYTRRNEPRPFKVPIVAPIFVLVVAVFIVVAPIVDNPRIDIFFAFLFIMAGLVVYFPFVHFKLVLPGTAAVTTFCQLLLECSVAESEADIKS